MKGGKKKKKKKSVRYILFVLNFFFFFFFLLESIVFVSFFFFLNNYTHILIGLKGSWYKGRLLLLLLFFFFWFWFWFCFFFCWAAVFFKQQQNLFNDNKHEKHKPQTAAAQAETSFFLRYSCRQTNPRN